MDSQHSGVVGDVRFRGLPGVSSGGSERLQRNAHGREYFQSGRRGVWRMRLAGRISRHDSFDWTNSCGTHHHLPHSANVSARPARRMRGSRAAAIVDGCGALARHGNKLLMNITALAGGVGASKLLRGLARAGASSELTVIVNTGDDIVLHGLRISPDLDIVAYTLAGVVNPTNGWGLRGGTFADLERLRVLGREACLLPGDRDR